MKSPPFVERAGSSEHSNTASTPTSPRPRIKKREETSTPDGGASVRSRAILSTRRL
jgi:hypothetical protein